RIYDCNAVCAGYADIYPAPIAAGPYAMRPLTDINPLDDLECGRINHIHEMIGNRSGKHILAAGYHIDAAMAQADRNHRLHRMCREIDGGNLANQIPHP